MKKNILACMLLCSCISVYAMEYQMDEDMPSQAEINKEKTLIITNRRNRGVWVQITDKKNRNAIIALSEKKINDKGRFFLENKECITIHYGNVGNIKVRVWDNENDPDYCYCRETITNQCNNEEFCIESDYNLLESLLDAGAMQK